MSKIDVMGNGNTMFRKIVYCSLLTLGFLAGSFSVEAEALPPTLVCDNQINVSLSEDCDALITVEMVLEGESAIPGFDPADFSITISGTPGSVITSPGIYTVTISENAPPNNSCWGHILVEDKLPPIITNCPCAPGNNDPDCVLAILCEDLGDLDMITVPQPTATDNCNNDFTLTFTDDVDGEDCSTSLVTRTWRFTDTEGNVVTCESEYRVDPLALGPIIVPPLQNVELDCGTGTTPQEIFDYFVDTYPPCTLPSCLDPNAPGHDAVVAQYEQLRFEFALERAYPSINGIAIFGNICNLAASYSDAIIPICTSIPGCSGNQKIIRTWTIYDWCNPTSDPWRYTQVIKASDNTPPSIDVKSFTASVDPWGCSTTVYFPEPLHLTDNCTQNAAYVVSTGSGSTDILSGPTGSGSGNINIFFDPDLGYYAPNVPVGQHIFYYNAYDCCDNITSEGIVVTVKDATPPVAITKQDIVVSLIPNPGSVTEPGLTKIFAQSVDNGSFDGCGPVKLEIRRETESCNYDANLTYNNDGHINDHDDDAEDDDQNDLDDGRFVTFCCNDLATYGIDEDGDGVIDYAKIKVWLRVWDDGDLDGFFGSKGDNYSEVWSYVRLEDKSQPTILCPGDITIDCNADSADLGFVGEAVAISSCGSASVKFEDIDRDLTNCNNGVITRKWYVEGSPHIFCYQKITLTGDITGDPIEVFFPNDTIIDCTEDYDIKPYWTAGPCDLMAYSVDRDTFFFAEGACYKILNYWTVINWCTYDPDDVFTDGIWTDVQVVKILDNDAPTIQSCTDFSVPADKDCVNNAVMLTNSAIDEGLCSSNRLSWTVQVDINGDWTIDYTYSSTAPPSSDFYISPTSSGEEVKITLPEGIPGSMTGHRVSWRVSDGCGNNATCTNYFMVVDEIPPTPYCVNLSTALMENGQVELWACDFDLGAFDNCSDNEDLRFTFSSTNPSDDPTYDPSSLCSARIFTCLDLLTSDNGVVTLDVYVWDEKDNFDFCTVFLTLVDNNDSCDDIGSSPIANIAGNIVSEKGEKVENVQVNMVSPQPGFPKNDMTDLSGHYMFSNNFMYNDYQVSGYKNDNPLNGVSTLDLVVIQRHILGIESLDSPFKRIAADANNDQYVTALDLIELRKLILGIYEDFPNNTSWRFVNESAIIDPTNPWPLTETRIVQDLDNNMMQEDFVAVKTGDVNGSAAVNIKSAKNIETRKRPLELNFTDMTYTAGDQVEMTLSSEQMNDLAGIQFTLNTAGLELINVTGNELEVNEANYAPLSKNVTTFSWSSTELKSVNELMTINFLALEDGRLSDNVEISSAVTYAEAYLGSNLDRNPIVLAGRNNSEQDFALFQNNPNPFSGLTTISFVIPEKSDVTLTVMDVTGKVLLTMNDNFERGLNSIDVSKNAINVSGVMYYRLDAGSYSATKKMIIIE